MLFKCASRMEAKPGTSFPILCDALHNACGSTLMSKIDGIDEIGGCLLPSIGIEMRGGA